MTGDSLQTGASRVIIARLEKENSEYEVCPVVLESNHPRFSKGTRFDFGFLKIALDEGYSVVYIGHDIPERAKLWKDGELVEVKRDRP